MVLPWLIGAQVDARPETETNATIEWREEKLRNHKGENRKANGNMI
jgi:hypothetical protein